MLETISAECIVPTGMPDAYDDCMKVVIGKADARISSRFGDSDEVAHDELSAPLAFVTYHVVAALNSNSLVEFGRMTE